MISITMRDIHGRNGHLKKRKRQIHRIYTKLRNRLWVAETSQQLILTREFGIRFVDFIPDTMGKFRITSRGIQEITRIHSRMQKI